MTVVVSRSRDLHAFAFRWGVTVRVRRDGFWRHVSLRAKRNPWEHYPGRCSYQVELETWVTAPGVVDRVAGSKRYVRVKVAP